ncbi:uncharacterized protein LOC123512529 isoform X2 [Portunus trituberculatus]|uniref:uncharacterized protein LOC123512529 isoform X2 n=1 Tax=Portunus trituberculatus TaxID=210409 RepID=UPI001E1D04C6|nr:uncharacterized protein LOC123512529 isoform X2 [Portunus trituberculatus]
MAEQTAPQIPPQHDKGNVTLCEPLPLHLSPRGRVKAGVGRRLETPSPLPMPPLPIEFVDVGASLPPASLCPPASDERARGRVSGIAGVGCHDRGHMQGSEGVPAPHQQVLAAGQTEGALVLGSEDLPRCVVVDLQGNVVVQETPPPPPPHSTTTPTPYLVDQPILVQVGPDMARQGTQTHSNGGLDGALDGTHCKPPTAKNGVDGSSSPRVAEQTSGGRKVEFGPRWSFKEVEVKEEHGAKDTNASEESTGGESDAEAGRPRRKSAKRARQRWKTIGEVEGGRAGVGRVRRHHPGPPPRDRSQGKAEDGERPWAGDTGEELPVWARRLSSVRVVDGQWVVGVASTSEVLQQTLEAHSRSVLCDYIKSHPSSLEQRHRAKCQASRIMWHHQRIRFDGVPFTILSSNDLKCAFAMNYKLKRKNKGSGGSQQRKGRVEGVEFGAEGQIGTDGGDGGDVEDLQGSGVASQEGGKEVVPKKKYKDIWFTSCPARITVKVIVKYPGYAVGIGAVAGERKAVMKALRRDLAQGISPQREELYHVTLPLRRLHNHPLQGRSRGIHPSIDGKVVSLLQEGVTAPKAIQQLLERHVEAVTAGDLVLPHPDDRAFHPRLKDVANLVYTRCRQMGITARRRPPDQAPFEAPHKKRRRPKRPREDGEMEGETEVGCGEPLGASTLQEAVQTFCTEESERGSDGGVGEARGDRSDVGLAELVRGQLDTLRGLTYTMQDTAALQEVYQGLQALINQYMAPTGPTLAGGGLTEVPSATATFILQDSAVDPLTITSGAPCVAEVPDTLALQEKDMGEAGKVRGSAALRQLRPPVALQCVTTSMVPTVVSQLPRAPNHAPPAHVVTSPAAPAPPTYQTLAPVAQDGPPPVHLSLPPYFYYVQEVTVPETSQTWTYSTSS